MERMRGLYWTVDHGAHRVQSQVAWLNSLGKTLDLDVIFGEGAGRREELSAVKWSDYEFLLFHQKLRLLPQALALPTKDILVVMLESDAFLNFADAAIGSNLRGRLSAFANANGVHHLIVRDLFSARNLREEGFRVHWSPQAADAVSSRLSIGDRRTQVGFIGGFGSSIYEERTRLLEYLRYLVKVTPSGERSSSEYLRALQDIKVFVTHGIGMHGWATEAKLFEAMSASCCIGRPRTPELDAMGFVSGRHYFDLPVDETAADLLVALLEQEELLDRVAIEGWRFVSQKHTWTQRADEVADVLRAWL